MLCCLPSISKLSSYNQSYNNSPHPQRRIFHFFLGSFDYLVLLIGQSVKFGDTPSVMVVLVALPVIFCSAGNFAFSGVPPDIFSAIAIEEATIPTTDSVVITIIVATKN